MCYVDAAYAYKFFGLDCILFILDDTSLVLATLKVPEQVQNL